MPLLGQAGDYSAVRSAVHALAPHLEVRSIEPSPIPGMVEVILEGQIVYISEDGRYLIEGVVFDIKNRRDITEERRSGLRKEAMGEVNKDEMIVFAAENPRHTITVFTDIDCGYCRKLHGDIDQYNDRGISVQYLFFPRAGLGSHSYQKAVSVYCADDSQSALTFAKLGEEPEPMQCDNPVSEHMKLGRMAGVTGTPAIVTKDGSLLAGYLPPDAMAARLDLLESLAGNE
jgi:thiol:disulfide interchange protein DsbC